MSEQKKPQEEKQSTDTNKATQTTKNKQKKNQRDFFTIAKYISLVAGVITALASFVLFPWLSDINRPSDPDIIQVKHYMDRMANEVSRLKYELDEIKKKVDTLYADIQKNPMSISPTISSGELEKLNSLISESQAKLAKLEEVILNNPAKALEMPLLKKELEGIKETVQANSTTSKQEIDRVYDLSKWFIGLMITSSVGLVALVVGTFFKKEKPTG